MELSSALPLIAISSLALAGSCIDILHRILPNWFVLLTLVCGLAFAGWAGGLGALPYHLAHVAAALALGFGLYVLKFWGAGDGKYYAAVAAWFSIYDFFALMLAISSVGLIVVFGYFLRYWGKLFSKDAKNIPYGVAIGAGAALAYLRYLQW